MTISEWLLGTLDAMGKGNVVALTLVGIASLAYGYFIKGRPK